MPDFVLEIGFEEMPARFLAPLTRELEENIKSLLLREMIKFESVQAFSTPRRLCACVVGIASRQDSRLETVTGPPASIAFDQDGNLTKAGQGFARSQQVDADVLFRRQTDKGEYLAVEKTVGGKSSLEVLPGICQETIRGFNFPKKNALV